MLKVHFRACLVVAAAVLTLALAPLPSHAAGLATPATGSLTAASWIDAASAWLHTHLLPAPARAHHVVSHARGGRSERGRAPWLHPTCDVGTGIDPNGHCL
jgi:hypothetical protein